MRTRRNFSSELTHIPPPGSGALFRQFNLSCAALGLFGAELVGIDGTFVKAVNSPQRNFTKAKVEKILKG